MGDKHLIIIPVYWYCYDPLCNTHNTKTPTREDCLAMRAVIKLIWYDLFFFTDFRNVINGWCISVQRHVCIGEGWGFVWRFCGTTMNGMKNTGYNWSGTDWSPLHPVINS